MKTDVLKNLIKEAVKEAIHEEMREILLEAVKANKQPIRESINEDYKTMKFNSSNVNTNPVNPRKAYMDILEDMSKGPSTGLEGEFKIEGPINTMAEGTSLPSGQLGLDQIMGLIGGNK